MKEIDPEDILQIKLEVTNLVNKWANQQQEKKVDPADAYFELIYFLPDLAEVIINNMVCTKQGNLDNARLNATEIFLKKMSARLTDPTRCSIITG